MSLNSLTERAADVWPSEDLHLKMAPRTMRRMRMVASAHGKPVSQVLRPMLADFVDREFAALGLAEDTPRRTPRKRRVRNSGIRA